MKLIFLLFPIFLFGHNFGQIFFVKTNNSTCLRLYGYRGFLACHENFSPLEEVVEFCPCHQTFIENAKMGMRGEEKMLTSSASTTKLKMPKLLKFDDSSEEEDHSMEFKNLYSTTTTIPLQIGKKEFLEKTTTIIPFNCPEENFGIVKWFLAFPGWAFILVAIFVSMFFIFIGIILGFFIAKRRIMAPRQIPPPRCSIMERGLPPNHATAAAAEENHEMAAVGSRMVVAPNQAAAEENHGMEQNEEQQNEEQQYDQIIYQQDEVIYDEPYTV